MPESDKLIFSPKDRWLELNKQPARAAFRQLMLNPAIQDALVAAYAEMASNVAVSRENLNGAQLFIHTFQNFSEPTDRPKAFPVKSLQSDLK